jgi:GPN-loop GTPase
MKADIFLYIMGTAGAGKSTMVNAFQSWMFRQGYNAVTLNLDPGGVNLPYNPDVDIRDWVRLEDIMDEYSLGPNGAQVTASDMMYMHIEDIRESLEGFRTDYYLVDTPGQMELYAYREPTRDLIGSLSLGNSASLFLYDPLLSRTPGGMVSQLTLASSIKYRLDMPFYQALNKVDILEDADRERILGWMDPEKLYQDLLEWSRGNRFEGTGAQGNFGDNEGNGNSQGSDIPMMKSTMETELGINLFRALEGTGEAANLVPCSATTLEGLEDLYSMVQASFMGGEDLDAA